jgi:hypothetical protein
LFAGIPFDEVDGGLLYAFATDEEYAAEIEDNYSLHISVIASTMLKEQVDVVLVLPKVLQ